MLEFTTIFDRFSVQELRPSELSWTTCATPSTSYLGQTYLLPNSDYCKPYRYCLRRYRSDYFCSVYRSPTWAEVADLTDWELASSSPTELGSLVPTTLNSTQQRHE